ncbi:stearoyl-CoA 9-desaturase [Diaporthe eres]
MAGKAPHISEVPITWRNWYQHLNWLNVFFVIIVPVLGFLGATRTPLHPYTAVFAAVYYFNTALGITADRAHHRHTDTEKDPYSVRKGLLHSHLGWMIFKQDPKKLGRADMTDLNQNQIVMWQHRNYLPAVIIMAWALPALVCGLWGDQMGGFIYAGILRCFFLQQATFCVNSLAHWIGEQPFDDRRSPRDHFLTAVVTLGEGYHNFHHEFPSDYRNAIEWWQYDPTKWMIWLWKQVGLAGDLKRFRRNEIEKGRIQQLQKALDRRRSQCDWGLPLEQLPIMSWDDFVEETRVNGKALLVVAGVIHDAADFVQEHPGGRSLLAGYIGKDATAAFNGGVYDHSNAAHNLLATMRVGVLRGGCEVEIWKRKVSGRSFALENDTYTHVDTQ